MLFTNTTHTATEHVSPRTPEQTTSRSHPMNYQTRASEPQPAIHDPRSESRCAATTRDGSPCHAHPVPGSDFCPFHGADPDGAVARGRGKGGAAPRRIRRLPVVLDHMHVATIL